MELIIGQHQETLCGVHSCEEVQFLVGARYLPRWILTTALPMSFLYRIRSSRRLKQHQIRENHSSPQVKGTHA